MRLKFIFLYNIIMEYLCHNWPGICSTCKHFPILSSFMTYSRVCNYINTTGASSGERITYPSQWPEFSATFSGLRVTRSLVLCVCLVDRCLSFFFWPLCCLSFFDLRFFVTPFLLIISLLVFVNFQFLICPLISSNLSCMCYNTMLPWRLVCVIIPCYRDVLYVL